MGSGIGSSTVVFAMTKVAASGLRAVRNHLHSSGHDAGGTATPSGIGRRGGAAEAFVKLLEERASYIISSNMNSVSYAHDYEGTLAR